MDTGPGDPWSISINPKDDNMIVCGYMGRVKQVNLSNGDVSTFECDARGKNPIRV